MVQLEKEKKKLEEEINKMLEVLGQVSGSKLLVEIFRLFYEYLKLLDKEIHMNREILSKNMEIINVHSKRIEELSSNILKLAKNIETLNNRIEELVKGLNRLEISIGSFTRRVGLDLEKMIIDLYREHLIKKGIRDVDKIEKLKYIDREGKYLRKGTILEVDAYLHNKKAYLLEIKSFVDYNDVEWFVIKCDVILNVLKHEYKREYEEVKRIILAVNITDKALERAKTQNIDVIYGSIVKS